MANILLGFDNRDVAIAFWLIILSLWCSSKPNIRRSISQVFAAAFARPLIFVFGFTAAYLILTTAALHAVDLWTAKQLKITAFWFFVAGIPSIMDVSKIGRNPELLKDAIRKNFKLSLLLDFFVNLFKMPLWVELAFVPITVFVGAMLGLAQSKKEYASVEKMLNRFLILLGISMLTFQAYMLSKEYESVVNVDTLRDFLLPIIYNFSFIPILWTLSIYSAYERVLSQLHILIKDSELRAFTKRTLIINFRTDIAAINSWVKNARSAELTNRAEISQSIALVKKSQDRRLN